MLADLLVWWLAVVALGALARPVAARLLPAFPDRGAGIAKPLGLVALGYASWLVSSAGLRMSIALPITAAGLVVAGALAWRTESRPSVADLLRDEGTFLAGFLAFAAVRAIEPAIFGAEKFMDFAFFNACVRTEAFPIEDPWMSGAAASYYTFGYQLFADLTRLTGAEPAIAYNLSLATVAATVVAAAASVGHALGGRFVWGLAGAVVTVGIGNLDGARQVLLEGRGIARFDFWRSTRVVTDTINEFPFFSFFHGDLHPHVTALVLDAPIAVLAVGIAAAREGAAGGPWPAALTGPRAGALVLLLAALAMTNPWDVPVQLALLGLALLVSTLDTRRLARSIAAAAAGLAAVTTGLVVLSLPFTLRFRAPFQGVGIVHAWTELVPFLVVFGFLGLPFAVFVASRGLRALGDPERRSFALAVLAFAVIALEIATGGSASALATVGVGGGLVLLLGPEREGPLAPALVLAVVAALCVLACEIVYLRDPYGADLHRMNTVFKLWFQAWLLLGLSFPAFAAAWLGRAASRTRPAIAALLVAGVAASAVYPAAAVAQRLRLRHGPFSLDGMAHLRRDHPDDAAAIEWLAAEVPGRPVVLEATGDPYSYFARVSANTGLPTVLGWANHEGVWRGGDARVARRRAEVDAFYRDPAGAAALSFLIRHRVRFVFVGELEREHHPAAALDALAAASDRYALVFRSGATEVFEVLAPGAARERPADGPSGG